LITPIFSSTSLLSILFNLLTYFLFLIFFKKKIFHQYRRKAKTAFASPVPSWKLKSAANRSHSKTKTILQENRQRWKTQRA